jgi:hypothetical protein
MTVAQTQAVTYTGNDTPFIDRIYRSRLTFDPGQTRVVPIALAARFLRHSDIFEEAGSDGDTAGAATGQALAQQPDDTAIQLEAAKKSEEELRLQEEARFSVLQQIEKMDKQALRDWTKQTYKQDLPGNLGLDNMRERVRGFVGQFGLQ